MERPNINFHYSMLSTLNPAGRPRIMLETASVAGGAVGVIFLICVVSCFVYVQKHRHDPLLEEASNGHQTNGHQNYGADVTDGPTTPCLCQQQSQIQISQLSSARSFQQHATNGDRDEHHRRDELQALAYTECPQHSKPKRPFGPHHDRPMSMADAILKR